MVCAPCSDNSAACAVRAMKYTIGDLLLEVEDALDRFWFVRDIVIIDQTEATVTAHLIIDPNLFVQAFLSERSQRLSFALVGQSRRLYGRDREHGAWHRHPFSQPEQHEPTPEGMSARPLTQFMAEVAQILLAHDLL